jgi:hypothetical protein
MLQIHDVSLLPRGQVCLRQPRSGATMPWGKHRGKPIEAVVAHDHRYADWLLGESWFWEHHNDLAEALRVERKRRRRREYVDRQGRLVLPDGTKVITPLGDAYWRFMRRAFQYGTCLVRIEPEVRDAA